MQRRWVGGFVRQVQRVLQQGVGNQRSGVAQLGQGNVEQRNPTGFQGLPQVQIGLGGGQTEGLVADEDVEVIPHGSHGVVMDRAELGVDRADGGQRRVEDDALAHQVLEQSVRQDFGGPLGGFLGGQCRG